VHKTTIYLPDDLKAAVTRQAAETGQSEATVIRAAIASAVASGTQSRPRAALFSSGDGHLSERVDELLAGFGDR
jgi:hypothetical protein